LRVAALGAFFSFVLPLNCRSPARNRRQPAARITAVSSREALSWPIVEPYGHISGDSRHTTTPDPDLELPLKPSRQHFLCLPADLRPPCRFDVGMPENRCTDRPPPASREAIVRRRCLVSCFQVASAGFALPALQSMKP